MKIKNNDYSYNHLPSISGEWSLAESFQCFLIYEQLDLQHNDSEEKFDSQESPLGSTETSQKRLNPAD